MQPSKTDVLVVVDMQNGFIEPRSKHVVPTIVNLVEAWSAAGGDILFTRYLNYDGSPYTRLIGWTKMMSPPETDIIDQLAPWVSGAHVLDKYVYTTFTDEGRRIFHEQGWTTPYIVGVDTESCVAVTAVDAFELDLTPRVVVDACASHAGPDVHDAGVLVMGRNLGGGQLVTVSDLERLLPEGTSQMSSMSP